MENGQSMTHLARMKSSFAEAEYVIDDCFGSEQRSKTFCAQSLNTNFNKNDFCETTFTLMQHVRRFKDSLQDLEEAVKDYKVINRNHEELTEKLVQKMVETTKNELMIFIPQPKENGKSSSEVLSSLKSICTLPPLKV